MRSGADLNAIQQLADDVRLGQEGCCGACEQYQIDNNKMTAITGVFPASLNQGEYWVFVQHNDVHS